MRLSFAKFIEKLNRGEFNSSDLATQRKAGWSRWVCDDSQLVKKTKTYGNFLASLSFIMRMSVPPSPIDLQRTFIQFENVRWTRETPIYDLIKICAFNSSVGARSDGSETVLWVLSFYDRREPNTVTVYSSENDFQRAVFGGERREVLEYFREISAVSDPETI